MCVRAHPIDGVSVSLMNPQALPMRGPGGPDGSCISPATHVGMSASISDILCGQHGLRRLRGGDSIGVRCAWANLLNCKAKEGGGGSWGSRRGSVLSGNSTWQFKAVSSWFPFKPVKQTVGEMIPRKPVFSLSNMISDFILWLLHYAAWSCWFFRLMLLFWSILSITNTIASGNMNCH